VQIGEDLGWEELVRASRTDDRDVSCPLGVVTVDETGRMPETPYVSDIVDGWLVPRPEEIEREKAALEVFHRLLRERLTQTPGFPRSRRRAEYNRPSRGRMNAGFPRLRGRQVRRIPWVNAAEALCGYDSTAA
jgi:hypothetical protein